MNFKNKKILLMGLGKLGRGLQDALFVLDKGAQLTITDLKSEEQLKQQVEKLQAHKNTKNLTLKLGGHDEKDFKDKDLIIYAAGVPKDSKYLKIAKKNNIKITMSSALFAKHAKQKGAILIGITGTKGKSTIAHLIYHSLKISSIAENKGIYLAGNIKGVATLPLIDKIKSNDIIILELDSWQLQGFGLEKVSPNIAIFSNFFDDHMNYYKSKLEYFADKSNIYLYQELKNGDILFIGEDVPKELIDKCPPSFDYIIPSYLPEDYILNIPGKHNIYNARFARETLIQIGVPEEEIKIAFSTFKGVSGRLYLQKTINQDKNTIHIYNDNNSTTPNSTVESIKTLKNKYKNYDMFLILGGADKNLDTKQLCQTIKKHNLQLITIPGTGTDKFINSCADISLHYLARNLKDALAFIKNNIKKDSIILFSPAFASFSQYQNEYEREEDFLKSIKEVF